MNTSPSEISFRKERYTPTDDPYAMADAIRAWRAAGIPERHAAKVRERHEATGPWGDAYRRLRDGLNIRPLVVLLGKRGTGKTQLGIDLLADIAAAGRAVKYLKALDLFREVRSCYRPDGPDEVRLLDRLRRFEGLVIDEAHERGESEWENRTLVNLMDHRYDAGRPTILVANLDRQSFATAMGPSVVSRLHECGEVVDCNWPSFREPAP